MLKEKMMRYKLMDSHMDLVKRGELGAARILLQLLRNGKVTLGLGDDEWNVEELCERKVCYIYYSRNGYKAVVHL